MGVTVREKPKGSGKWWVYIHHAGQRKAKYIGQDKEQAHEVAKKIHAKLVLKEYQVSDEPAPNFSEYAEIWRENYIKPLRRASTYERYGNILTRYVNPAIGSMPVDEIRRKHIRDLLLKVHRAGGSRSTIAIIRDVISGVMGYAVEDEIIDANPVTGILKRLKLERDKSLQVIPLSHEQVDLFLTTCRKVDPDYYVFFLMAFRTGMRLGELLALKWACIDWNEKNILVEKSYRRGVEAGTKTDKNRLVDMSDQLILELKKLYAARKREGLAAGAGGPVVDIIFHRDGKHMEQNFIRRVFKRILKKAGMRETKLHITRHTFASLLLTSGVSPVYVKEQLGHSSIDITVDIYGHLIPSSHKKTINLLDNASDGRNLYTTKNKKKL